MHWEYNKGEIKMKVKLKSDINGPTFKVLKFDVGQHPGVLLLNKDTGEFKTTSYDNIVSAKIVEKNLSKKKTVETSGENRWGY